MPRDGTQTNAAVTASPAALQTIRRLGAAHGALMFFQSGGCCDGSSPLCLKQGELPLGPHDVCLGHLAGAPFYIDAEQYRRWGSPRLTIEISQGAADGFSLEALEGLHFVTQTRA